MRLLLTLLIIMFFYGSHIKKFLGGYGVFIELSKKIMFVNMFRRRMY